MYEVWKWYYFCKFPSQFYAQKNISCLKKRVITNQLSYLHIKQKIILKTGIYLNTKKDRNM